MPRHDNFIPVSNFPTWRLTDAWIPVGGSWLYLEFTARSTQTPLEWTVQNPSLILSATDGNVVATYEAVSYHERGAGSVVTAAYKLSRVVSRTETIHIQSTGNARLLETTPFTWEAGLSVTNPPVRNYGNCDSSGNPLYSLRSGNSTSVAKTIYSYPHAPVDGMQLRGRDTLSGGTLSQGTTSMSTLSGGLTKSPNDFRFNNKDSVLLSGDFLGKLQSNGIDYQWQPQTQYRGGAFVLFMQEGSVFAISSIQDTTDDGGTPVRPGGTGVGDTDGPDEIVGVIPSFDDGVVAGPSRPPKSGIIQRFDLITISTITKTMRITIPGIEEVVVPLGKISERAIIFGFRWSQQDFEINIIGPNGQVIKSFDSSLVPDFPVPQDYLGLRSSGNVWLGEFAFFNTGQNWSNDAFVQEFVAMLDHEYGTPAREVYVDFQNGSDTLSGSSPANAVRTLSRAMQQVAVGSGDQILCKTGTTVPQRSSAYTLGIGDGVPLGYSPDFPFVLGYYDNRSNGRVETDFQVGASSFLNIECLNPNVAVHGHRFKSAQRDPQDPEFVGYTTMRANASIEGGQGFGIVYDQPLLPNAISGSIQVVDTEIANAARHSICLRTYDPSDNENDPEQFKYSGGYRTIIHDSWNPRSVDTQNPEPIRTGGDPGLPQSYGIAGVYCEGVSGLHFADALFYRVGWQPNVIVAGISNALVSTNSRGTIFKTTTAPATTGMDNLPPSWIFASNPDPLISNNTDDQRVHIVGRNGSPVSIYATVFRTVDSFFDTPLRIEFKENRVDLGLNGLDRVDAYLLDGGARTSGNMDFVFNAPGNTTAQNQTVTNRCLGLFGIVDTVHIESSGYIVMSQPSYFVYGMVSENNLYGLNFSPDYTHVDMSFFGGTAGTDYARRHSNSTYSGASATPVPAGTEVKVGSLTVDHGFAKHAWVMRTPFNSSSKRAKVDHNIVAYFGGTNLSGSVDYDEDNSRYPSAAFYFGPQPNPGVPGKIDITYCTVHGMPGSAINVAYPGTQTELNIRRVLIDQPLPFNDTANFAYAFDFPYRSNNTAVIGSSVGVNYLEFNLYNQNNLGASSGAFTFARTSNTLNSSFTGWTLRADTGDPRWKDISFATAGASIPTYNVDVLAGTPSVVGFATTAIAAHADGWDSDYTAGAILGYLRDCYLPTNLDAADYGNDYLGAVEFGFGSPPVDPPFLPQNAITGTFFNYGRGF